MSEVNNTCPLERIIHQAFHDIAKKYNIDVDIVAEIIEEYSDILSKKLEEDIVINLN